MFLIDYFYKAVPDFIDFHIGNFHWFIFNIADVFITVGVIFMILIEIIGNNKKIKYEKNLNYFFFKFINFFFILVEL